MGGSKATKEQRSIRDSRLSVIASQREAILQYRRLLPGAVTSEAAARVTSFFG